MLYSRVAFFVVILAATVSAQERRAPAPQFNEEQLKGIFFDKLSDAIRGERPTLSSLRNVKAAATTNMANTAPSASSDDRWTRLIQPSSLEDEVKRIKLHLDSIVTTPSAFSSGGFQEARQDLTVLAAAAAVVARSGSVRLQRGMGHVSAWGHGDR